MPFQQRWIKLYLLGMLVSGVSSILGIKQLAAEGVFLVSTSLCLFVVSQSIPASAKLVLHPITATLLGSWAAAAVWAVIAGPGTTFKDVLQHFANGAGAYLSMFLSPLVVALAVLLFEKRKLLTQNFIPMVTTALMAAGSGLFGTALLARALRLPQSLALASAGRCLTAPLALAVSQSLDAQPALAIPMVVITGLLGAAFATPLLGILRLPSARARGLAVGASSHVLGTVSLAQADEEAFPYAAVGFVLVGGFSVLLLAVPCVQQMLLSVLSTSSA